jgi:hypothetical protein
MNGRRGEAVNSVAPVITVIEVSLAQSQALASARSEPARLAQLLDTGTKTYTPLGVRLADARSRSWAAGLDSPYAKEIADVALALDRPGAFFLNYSYEWGCTTGAIPDPDTGGTTLFRTLDWPFDGLGRALVIVRQQALVGDYMSVTWPGFAGILTGLAPGRFAAAINQPPLPLPGWGKPIGWLAARLLVNRSNALPPDHLLRLVFDTAPSFAEAARLLRQTPVCMPAIFTLAGPRAGEALVIERTRHEAFEPGVATAANHWAATPGPLGRARNKSSHARRAMMSGLHGVGHDWSLDWLRPPILQDDTRVAVIANPCNGRLMVQGWEKTGAATKVLDLDGGPSLAGATRQTAPISP